MRATSVVLLGLALAWGGAASAAAPPAIYPGLSKPSTDSSGLSTPSGSRAGSAKSGQDSLVVGPGGPIVDGLVAKGFVVMKSTQVDGDFDGCDYDRKVPLKGAGVFTCNSFGYMHAYRPRAVLLKSPDGHAYKLVIENAVFDGDFSYS